MPLDGHLDTLPLDGHLDTLTPVDTLLSDKITKFENNFLRLPPRLNQTNQIHRYINYRVRYMPMVFVLDRNGMVSLFGTLSWSFGCFGEEN